MDDYVYMCLRCVCVCGICMYPFIHAMEHIWGSENSQDLVLPLHLGRVQGYAHILWGSGIVLTVRLALCLRKF